MSLPAGQQRVLLDMENALQASEPRLASMFAIFARLNKEEPVSAEPLRSRFWQAIRAGTPVCALVLILLMLAMITGALLGGTAHGAATCGSQHKTGGSYLMRRPACTLAVKSALGQTTGTGAVGLASGAARKSCAARPVRTAALSPPAPAGAITPRQPATC